MKTSSTITAKQYYEANNRIIALFEHLEQVVDCIDQSSAKGKTLRNPKDLFQIAEKIVKIVGDSAHIIHETYVAHIQNGNSSMHTTSLIETEAWKIFNAIRSVVIEAKQLDVDPITNDLLRCEKPYYDDLQMRRGQSPSNRKTLEGDSAFQAKRGAVQTAIIKEARRLGPEYGSDFLLAVDDTFLALLTMLQAVKATGIDIDLDQLPGIETGSENWIEPKAPLNPKEVDIETAVRHLSILMQTTRADAVKAWATGRTH